MYKRIGIEEADHRIVEKITELDEEIIIAFKDNTFCIFQINSHDNEYVFIDHKSTFNIFHLNKEKLIESGITSIEEYESLLEKNEQERIRQNQQTKIEQYYKLKRELGL